MHTYGSNIGDICVTRKKIWLADVDQTCLKGHRNIYLSNKITTGTFSNSQWKETKILLPVLLHGIIKLLHNNRE